MRFPMTVMWFVAKELPDRVHQSLRAHLACLFEKDGWIFSALYIVTAGGFIGVASFLPTYFCDQFRVTKVEAGQLTMLATLMSTVARVVGGQFADRIGGVNVLSGVLLLVSATLLLYGRASASLTITTLLLAFYFSHDAGTAAPCAGPMATPLGGAWWKSPRVAGAGWACAPAVRSFAAACLTRSESGPESSTRQRHRSIIRNTALTLHTLHPHAEDA